VSKRSVQKRKKKYEGPSKPNTAWAWGGPKESWGRKSWGDRVKEGKKDQDALDD